MTFFMIGGIVSIMTSVVLIIVYLIAHKADEHSITAKIIMWIGMLFSAAGASLLTIEYSFPNISHPKPPYAPTVYDHFVEFYDEGYKELITYTNIYQVSHTQTTTIENEESKTTYFITKIVYDYEQNYYDTSIMNGYTYNEDYSLQSITSKIMNQGVLCIYLKSN